VERDPDAWCRDTLTRLAALDTLSRNAGEGLLGATAKLLSRRERGDPAGTLGG
jgi:hypothetical protein